MRTAFRAIVTEAHDISKRFDRIDPTILAELPEEIVLKAARFTIESVGLCPEPFDQLVNDHIAVFDLQTIQDVLRMLVKGLAKYKNDYTFTTHDLFALSVGSELLAQIMNPTRQEAVDNIVNQTSHPVPPASQSRSGRRAGRQDQSSRER
jgi:hypothetical protein